MEGSGRMSSRWRQIEASAPSVGGSMPWTSLPESGLGAVIAYLAGPGRVRPKTCAPKTDKDFALLTATVSESVEADGIPAPPHPCWEIALSLAELDELLRAVLSTIADREGPTSNHPLTDYQREGIQEAIDEFYAALGRA